MQATLAPGSYAELFENKDDCTNELPPDVTDGWFVDPDDVADGLAEGLTELDPCSVYTPHSFGGRVGQHVGGVMLPSLAIDGGVTLAADDIADDEDDMEDGTWLADDSGGMTDDELGCNDDELTMTELDEDGLSDDDEEIIIEDDDDRTDDDEDTTDDEDETCDDDELT